MNKVDKNRKLIFIISIAVLVVITIASSTVAYFGWIAEEESSINVTVIGGTGKCDFKSDNNVEIKPVASRDSGRIIKFTAKQELAGEAPIVWNMVVNEIGGLQHSTFKYEMINTTTGASYGSGNFENISNVQGSNTITFSNDTEKLTYNTEYEFTLYIWIDGTIGDNPFSMAGQEFDFDMNCVIDGTNGGGGSSNTLINYIRNLYTSGTPTLITQGTSGDSYYYSYQDTGSTWGLMNDGLTIDTTQDEETTGLAKVVTDATKLTSGTEGNIRYFGPSDSVNNYIYFNCDNYSNQSSSTCELWRIIGIVDGKVKIIKNDSIDFLSWDYDYNDDQFSTSYTNNWSTSSLKNLLNGAYYNNVDTIYYNYYDDGGLEPVNYINEKNTTSTLLSNKGGTTNTKKRYTIQLGASSNQLNFNSNRTGITEATRLNNLISESTWYLGGKSSSDGLYPNDIYNHERQNIVGTTILSGNPFTINANIGLMYASDYGYGTDLTKCSKDINNYSNSANSYACRANNWLFNSANQWLITSHSSSFNYASIVDSSGYVSNMYSVYLTGNVRPVLYLNSELAIESVHEGTSTDPYRISV